MNKARESIQCSTSSNPGQRIVTTGEIVQLSGFEAGCWDWLEHSICFERLLTLFPVTLTPKLDLELISIDLHNPRLIG